MILIRWLSVVARRIPRRPLEADRNSCASRPSLPTLTRWDVALVVFKILGVLGALIGLVFALIST